MTVASCLVRPNSFLACYFSRYVGVASLTLPGHVVHLLLVLCNFVVPSYIYCYYLLSINSCQHISSPGFTFSVDAILIALQILFLFIMYPSPSPSVLVCFHQDNSSKISAFTWPDVKRLFTSPAPIASSSLFPHVLYSHF